MPLNYKPYEEQQLEALLKSGLVRNAPDQAYQIFQGLQGGAIDRRAQNQQQAQALMNSAMQAMQGYATSEGADKQGLNALLNSFQAANPQLERPKYASGLEGLVQSLTPMTMGGGGGGGQDLQYDQETAQGVWSDAMLGATGDPANGIAPKPLHDTRMIIMANLRQQGYSEQALAEAYDAIGRAYQAAGAGDKLIGRTPITGYGSTAMPSYQSLLGPGEPPPPADTGGTSIGPFFNRPEIPQPIGPGTYGGNQHMADWLQQVYANQRA